MLYILPTIDICILPFIFPYCRLMATSKNKFPLCVYWVQCLYLLRVLLLVHNRNVRNTNLWPFRVSRLTQALKIHVYNRDLRAYSSYIEVDLPWNDQRQDTRAASRSISMPSTLLCSSISNGLIFLSFCCFQNDPIYRKNCRVLCRIFYSILVNINWFTYDRIFVSKDKLFPSLFLPFFRPMYRVNELKSKTTWSTFC